MSITVPAPNGHSKPAEGVRTYRGRKLEDLIPSIRQDLGADAIILREPEGLMGGINGFFAQRFIEVEARADPADAVPLQNRQPDSIVVPGGGGCGGHCQPRDGCRRARQTCATGRILHSFRLPSSRLRSMIGSVVRD